ncbi:hypothetical protein JZ751_015650 [Albula glossodonta]|uniref:Uncharacterized protein n=1 Tax=Albula glossodonta TaxID=121402 RepID=A0A8T2NRM2_9TELE|nr:hypothetical protein JZ751_015650 [Albula glossodonta]
MYLAFVNIILVPVSLPAIYGEGDVDIQAVWTDGHSITDYSATQQLFCPDSKIRIPALLLFLHLSHHARGNWNTGTQWPP